jgi:xanthine dehydrogenase accessory factor
MIEFFQRLTELLSQGRTLALVSVLSTSGSSPQRSGARMIVTREGEAHFTIGGGGLEAAALADAMEAINTGVSVVREYGLSGSGPESVGMVCGGRATIVIEVISAPQKLLVIGAGHVGRAIVEAARDLGFAMTVVDDRPEYLLAERFSGGVATRLTTSDYSTDIPVIDESTYVVIVTRSHETDLKALRYVLDHRSAYVGMMGSGKKVRATFESLVADGVSPKALEEVHAPIGLDIGSKTPKEVAISVLAEILRVRNTVGEPSRK